MKQDIAPYEHDYRTNTRLRPPRPRTTSRVRRLVRHSGLSSSGSRLRPSSPDWTSSFTYWSTGTSISLEWWQAMSPVQPHALMLVVGVIEIVAGIGVALRPRIFAYIVAAWLALIIINLLLIPGYFDDSAARFRVTSWRSCTGSIEPAVLAQLSHWGSRLRIETKGCQC